MFALKTWTSWRDSFLDPSQITYPIRQRITIGGLDNIIFHFII